MYGMIKHSDKKQEIVNLNCKVYHLLNFLRKKCQFKDDLELDVCDMNGEAKHLNENPDAYANSLLKHKDEFILIKLERLTADAKPNYVPLLNDNHIVTDEFLAKLNISKKVKTVIKPKPKAALVKKKPLIGITSELKPKEISNLAPQSHSPDSGLRSASPGTLRNKSPQKF